MKKLTTILTAFILLISASAFAAKNEIISAEIRSAFAKTFANASNVKWKKLNEYYLADFIVNNQNASAAYNEKAELVSAARTISLEQIPFVVTLNLQNRYPGYTLANSATELTTEGVTTYFIKGEDAKRTVTFKASSFGDLSVENKTKKK